MKVIVIAKGNTSLELFSFYIDKLIPGNIMPRNINVILSTKLVRDFTLTLEPISGGLTMFYAFINGIRIIQADGTKKRTWKGKIPDAQINIKVRAVGINNAIFKLGIDLPGTADDQSLMLQLKGGYYETELTL